VVVVAVNAVVEYHHLHQAALGVVVLQQQELRQGHQGKVMLEVTG
jgi:hypothetical protein